MHGSLLKRETLQLDQILDKKKRKVWKKSFKSITYRNFYAARGLSIGRCARAQKKKVIVKKTVQISAGGGCITRGSFFQPTLRFRTDVARRAAKMFHHVIHLNIVDSFICCLSYHYHHRYVCPSSMTHVSFVGWYIMSSEHVCVFSQDAPCVIM